MNIRGIFASDIDNTLTDKRHIIPDEVVNYLVSLHKNGWQIVFLTGRTFSFALMSMEKFTIPYILGVQNGAEVISMPEKKVIYRNFINRDLLKDLDLIFAVHSIGYIVYSGFEGGDFCYYQPQKFSDEMLAYFKKLQALSSVDWVSVDSWAEVPSDSFPLIKCFGEREKLNAVCAKIMTANSLCASVITDSVDPNKGILLITGCGVDKGETLKRLKSDFGWTCPVVGAGDDDNDIPLLQAADIGICVEGGSLRLSEHADFMSSPSADLGIIAAMERVIKERGL